jgi:hypothetical protein
LTQICGYAICKVLVAVHPVHLAGGGGGGGMFALAIPTQAKMPTLRITHPQTSYQKSVSSFFFLDC